MRYKNKILIHKNALKFLESLDEKRRSKIKNAIEKLKFFPLVKMDVVKIKGFENSFRLKVGNIRVWFEYDKSSKIIFIRKIGFREGFYK